LTPRLIFLIGYRGTGKSTVARLVAERLGWNWLDADHVLETRFSQSIAEIFAREGESGFREKEEIIVADLCRLQAHVIATGGGVILRAANRERLKESGRVIWLTADADTIWQRLQSDPSTKQRRPELTVGGRAEIEELLQTREPLYRASAEWTVSTVNKTPEEIAGAILEKIAHEK
jgi:shikimate kinase